MSRGPAPWRSSDVAWQGGRRPYDLVKELIASGIVVAVLVTLLAVLFASPDPPSVTLAEWANHAPKDFVATTLSEIDQTSLSASYGPPYQSAAGGSTQGFAFLSPEKWFGESIPIDTWTDFVKTPLSGLPSSRGPVDAALAQWQAASSAQQAAWSKAYSDALTHASFAEGAYDVPTGDYGPLGTVLSAQYAAAISGALDNAFKQDAAGWQGWYSNNQTDALLYMGDSGQGGAGPDCIGPAPFRLNRYHPTQVLPKGYGCWYYNRSVQNSAPRYGGYLAGSSWGIINEVGNWPGAWWLAPYSFWYQWGPGLTSQSADLWAMLMTAIVSVAFLLIPWIPGLRDIPRVTGLYRVMWGDYYRLVRTRKASEGHDDLPD